MPQAKHLLPKTTTRCIRIGTCASANCASAGGSTMLTMRRTLAMLLVALFGFGLMGPVVSASEEDFRLPACCRRDGKHSCAMTAIQRGSSSGHSVQAARCRLFPSAKAFPPGRTVSLRGASRMIFGGLVSHSASRSQVEVLYRTSYSRACQGRAPPNSLS